MQLDTSESGILLNQHTSTQASGFFVCRKFRKINQFALNEIHIRLISFPFGKTKSFSMPRVA